MAPNPARMIPIPPVLTYNGYVFGYVETILAWGSATAFYRCASCGRTADGQYLDQHVEDDHD